jgi:hypothetical protein
MCSNVCSFGERAKLIKNKVNSNEVLSVTELRLLLAKATVKPTFALEIYCQDIHN